MEGREELTCAILSCERRLHLNVWGISSVTSPLRHWAGEFTTLHSAMFNMKMDQQAHWLLNKEGHRTFWPDHNNGDLQL